MTYNPWPLGQLPEDWQRPELRQVMDQYGIIEPWDVVDLFERTIADFAGSDYAVAVDSCTHALFLCFQYKQYIDKRQNDVEVYVPQNTYLSIPQMVKQSGLIPILHHSEWTGIYELESVYGGIFDGAVRFSKNMFIESGLIRDRSFLCTSFQIKKRLPVGRGGMIFTNDRDAYHWLKAARYDGRDLTLPYDKQMIYFDGWHMYMTPEDAARGMQLFDKLKQHPEWPDFPDTGSWKNYPDLREFKNVRWY